MGLIWFIILSMLVVHGGAETVVKEEADVKWTNGTEGGRDKHPSLPDIVVLSLTIDNETATLRLTKNERDNFEEVPVVVGGENNNVTVWHHKKDEVLSVYSDKSKDASFSVVMKNENGINIAEYYGFFVHKEVKYSLTPKNYHEMSDKTSDVVHEFTLNGTNYVVFKDKVDKSQANPVDDDVEDSETTFNQPKLTTPSVIFEVTIEELNVTVPNPPEVNLNPSNEQNNLNYGITSTETRSQRRKRNEQLTLQVDMMVIIDYAMYSRWLRMNNNDESKTIERMRYYLAHVLNGVNNVYSSMASPKLFVTVVEIFIASTAQQSWYFEDPSIKNQSDPKQADFENALKAFREWVLKCTPKRGEVQNKEKFIPEHDAVVVFTDYNESPTEGLAYRGTICGDHAQGLIHEKGQYDTITTAAHELAHILGSKHDGQDNNCDPNDHYLMSPVMSNAKIENRDRMSICTMRQIVEKAMQLQGTNENCMDPLKKSSKRMNLDQLFDSRPGARFSVDEQCQLRFGSEYKFCSEGEDTCLTVCNQMRCLNTKDNRCYGGYPKAMDGTTCGSGKWCVRGQCVNGNPNRLAGKGTCIFGDKSDSFRFNGVLMSCKDLKNQPSACGTQAIRNWCCKTCEEIKNTGSPNCPYGDIGMQIQMGSRIYGCELVFQNHEACNEPTINTNCCDSCNKARMALK